MIRRITIACVVLVVLASCRGESKRAEETDFADVKVGLLLTTGGKGGDLAGPSIGAARLAADHLRKDHGTKITIEEADYAGDLSIASQLAADLADKVEALIVATDDAAVLGSIEAIRKPIIHAYVTAGGVTGRTNVFRLAPSDELQAERLAEFLVKTRKLKRIATIYEKTEFGTSGADAFASAVEFRQATIVSEAEFETGGDIHTPLSQAADGQAQAVAIWTDNPAEAARAVIDAHKSGHSYQIALPGNTAVPQFGKNAVAQVVPTAFREGILSVGPWAGPWLNDSQIRRFYREFEKKQNDLAPVRSAQVYDAVQILAAAKGTGDISNGLRDIRDFRGASVPITFDSSREGMDETDLWAWGFTKSKTGSGAEFFPAVDTGGGFFTLIPKGLEVPARFRYLLA